MEDTRYGVEESQVRKTQPQFGEGACESIQYELFFGQSFLSIRVKRTPSCTFTDAWFFDGGVKDLFRSLEPMEAGGGGDSLDIRNASIALRSDGPRVEVTIVPDRGDRMVVNLTETRASSWRFPPDDVVVHMPLLTAEMICGGETRHGTGYGKWYRYGEEVGYMAWRFIAGLIEADGGPTMIWTADAAFDLKKYDYFKIARPGADILTADQPGTYHRDRMAYGLVGGTPYTLEIADLGRVTRVIQRGETNLKLQRGFCSLTVTAGDRRHTGYAFNEIACGTGI